ncbi:MAG TPA: hypothetical protein PKO28_02415 [Bacilli bacterium]|nr:hypothetical protein [Bacilli bacterium]
MPKIPNRIVKNRQSPKNEKKYIEAYKSINPSAKKKDGRDISAVTTKSGTRGHALLPKDINRSKDSSNHIGKSFVSDFKLKKEMKNKK